MRKIALQTSDYRVPLVVVHLGWADLDLGCSTLLWGSRYVVAVTAHQPGELAKSESTQARCTTTMVTLYSL